MQEPSIIALDGSLQLIKRWLLSLLAFMNLLLNNLKSIAEDISKRWVAYRFSYAKRHNEAEGGRWVSLMTFWNSEKLSNFKAHKLSWTVNELCIRIVRVSSLCPPIAHSSYSPPKFILLQFLAPKCNTRDKKREKNTHTQATRQRKLEIPCYNIQL